MSLPAAARHRWGLAAGGRVDVIDLGYAVVTMPSGEVQRLFADLLDRDAHAAFVASLDDDDLRTS